MGELCVSSYRSSTARRCPTSFVPIAVNASRSFGRRISPTRTASRSTPIATSCGSPTSPTAGASRLEQHRTVTVVPDVAQLVRACDLILFTTVASTPHITDVTLFEHNPLVLHISLRDLAPEILLRSQNVVDDVEHVMKANTSPHLAEQKTGNRSFVTGTLADIMTGRRSVNRDRPIIFSPFGMGMLDLAVGKWVYDQAVASGQELRLSDFFYETVR